MKESKNKKIFASIEETCLKAGVRLTPKKREIFETLFNKKKALSAYEIADLLKEKNHTATPVMSIYRALDFFKERGLVHKINSLNCYSICSHISCKHKHDLTRLAVCLDCHSVDEVSSNTSIKKTLEKSLNEINFKLQNQQIELLGLCVKCRKKTKNKS